MVTDIDQVAKIQNMYREGTGPVPYATFMAVFNRLLRDPDALEPKKPNEDLLPFFRAVCMAASVGILDAEQRQEQRIQEFLDNVYPVWQEALEERQMREYDNMIENRPGGPVETPEFETEGTSEESAALLRRLGLTEGQPESASQRTFESVDRLVENMRGQDAPLERTTWSEQTELAHYQMGEHQVDVTLVEDDGLELRLAVGVGHSRLNSPVDRVKEIAGGMGYERTEDFEWQRTQVDVTYALKIEPTSTHITCALPPGGSDDRVLLELQRAHRDLGEVVELLRG